MLTYVDDVVDTDLYSLCLQLDMLTVGFRVIEVGSETHSNVVGSHLIHLNLTNNNSTYSAI